MQLIAESSALCIDAPAEFRFFIEIVGQLNNGALSLNNGFFSQACKRHDEQ